MGSDVTDRAGEPAAAADASLAALVEELAGCVESLRVALSRAEEIQEHRERGAPWADVVASETRPLIVERITTVLDALNTAGSRWRHDEARALYAAGMSINKIAALFAVTRQRASVLVRGSEPAR